MAADDKSCIVGPFPLWFGDMMDCMVGVNRLCCTHRNPHWRHDGLVVQVLAASLFEGASSCSHKTAEIKEGDKHDDASQRIGVTYALGQTT